MSEVYAFAIGTAVAASALEHELKRRVAPPLLRRQTSVCFERIEVVVDVLRDRLQKQLSRPPFPA
jgi:hypothetical protein